MNYSGPTGSARIKRKIRGGGDMRNYDIIMKAEKEGLGYRLDKKIKDKKIPAYFRETYGMSYHSASILLYLGEFPGIEKKLGCEITEEINRIQGCHQSKVYFTTVTLYSIKLYYPELTWPEYVHRIRPEKFKPAYGGGRPKKNAIIGSTHRGICMNCSDSFEVDIYDHPTNLCGCLKCYPDGIGFSPSTTRQELYQRKNVSVA